MTLEIKELVSSELIAKSGVTVVIPAGVAGSQVSCFLGASPIMSDLGDELGNPASTSLVLTSTTFLNEITQIEFERNKNAGTLTNGDYYVDYQTGRLVGIKADASIAMTADYSIRSLNTGATLTGGSAKTYSTNDTDLGSHYSKVGQTGDTVNDTDYVQVIAGRDNTNALRPILTDTSGAIKAVLDGVTLTANEINVNIDHTTDSTKLGDGTNLITSTTVAAKQGLDVNVIQNESPAPTTIYNGSVTVASAGTAEQLSASSVPVKKVTIIAHHNNAGLIFIGDSLVDSGNGYPCEAGQSLDNLEIDDLNKIYIDSEVNGDSVRYIAS